VFVSVTEAVFSLRYQYVMFEHLIDVKPYKEKWQLFTSYQQM